MENVSRLAWSGHCSSFDSNSKLVKPDLVLFTGDFGNENVDLVQSVADLQFPKAVILGNHDSWCTQQFSQKRKDGVQLQLECLGEEHVGYRHLDFPSLKLSVVGGRPFSCGGDRLFRKKLLSARYGIQDMDGSAVRIYNTALRTPENHLIIFLAHNGPTGLGSNLNDICGKDWVFGGGDHGDPDLAQAIAHLKETTRLNIPLVVFGHMHKELAHGNGLRKMIVISNDKTIYLNGAIVPRVKRINDDERSPSSSFMNSETSQLTSESRGTKRAFTVVEILEGRVDKIAETWVSVNGDVTLVEEEHVLFEGSN
uniref:Calcineurin-like phosphoesterase domain-containing protein n=1 Tax=Manihot esculenta TaxID=3983 RepID=A0A2C9VML4_MANES